MIFWSLQSWHQVWLIYSFCGWSSLLRLHSQASCFYCFTFNRPSSRFFASKASLPHFRFLVLPAYRSRLVFWQVCLLPPCWLSIESSRSNIQSSLPLHDRLTAMTRFSLSSGWVCSKPSSQIFLIVSDKWSSSQIACLFFTRRTPKFEQSYRALHLS